MKKSAKVVFAAFVVCLLSFPRLEAQEGFKVGIDFPLGSFPFGDIQFAEGFGGGFRVGYGFEERASVWLSFVGASHLVRGGVLWIGDATNAFADWSLGWVNIDLKYLFETEASMKPFVLGGLGIGVLTANSNNSLTGYSLTGGGGGEYFLTDHWALNIAGAIHFTRFTLATARGQSGRLSKPLNEHAFTANLGILYHF